jgi:RNA-binding motif X-linked protein 2
MSLDESLINAIYSSLLSVVKEIQRINEREISSGISEGASWHAQYKDSPYVFIGGIPFELTEGDVICIFSQ